MQANANIYGNIQPPQDPTKIIANLQAIEQARKLNPIVVKQKQAELQSSLTQNEADRLKLEQQTQENEFKKYIDTTPPVYNPDKTVNVSETLANMRKAGFGRYANQFVASQLDTDIKNSQTQDELINAVRKNAVLFAQQHQGESKETIANAEKQADEYALQKYGKSFSDVLGPGWMSNAMKMNVGMLEMAGEKRTQLATYTDEEAKNPKSDINKKFKEYIATRAPEFANYTLYDAMRIPAAKGIIDSFNIDAGTRLGGFQTATEQGVAIDKMTNLRDSLASRLSGWKPGEVFSRFFSRIKNTPQQADIDQVIAELKSYGIDIENITNPQGAINALNRQITAAQGKKEAAEKLQTTTTLQGATKSTPSKGDLFKLPDGRVFRLTKEQQALTKYAPLLQKATRVKE